MSYHSLEVHHLSRILGAWEEMQLVTIDLKVDIVTSPDDGLIVLADALLGELDMSLENVHNVTVLKVNAKVNGRSIYNKNGNLR